MDINSSHQLYRSPSYVYENYTEMMTNPDNEQSDYTLTELTNVPVPSCSFSSAKSLPKKFETSNVNNLETSCKDSTKIQVNKYQ